MKKQVKVFCVPSLVGKTMEQVNALIDDVGTRTRIDSLNWRTEYPYKPITDVTLAYTNTYLYIKWHVNGIMLKAVHTADFAHVNEDSCVEFFCAVPNSDYYINFEFNCIGTANASMRKGRKEDVQRLPQETLQRVLRYSSLGRRPFCEIDGQFTWDLLIAIPWDLILFGVQAKGLQTVPHDEAGNLLLPSKLQGNFYKCADDTSARHFVSWAPISTDKPDFHRPEFFGDILLLKE